MQPSSEPSSEVPEPVPFVSLSNSLLTTEVARTVWDWRNTHMTNYDAMIRIESALKEYREDLI